MQIDDELRQIFLGEIASYLAVLSDPGAGLVKQSQAAHSLKGAAGMLGFVELQGLGAVLERSLAEGETASRDEHLPRIREIVATIGEIEAAGAEAPGSGRPTKARSQEPPPELPPEPPEMEGFDDETIALLQSIFVEEARDHLASMEQSFILLSEDPSAQDAVDTLFRAAHTLKGAAATVNLKPIGEGAHLLEKRLEHLKDAGEPIVPAVLDQLVGSSDVLRKMVDAASNPASLSALLEQLRRVIEALPVAATDPAASPPALDQEAPEAPGEESSMLAEWDDETKAIILETFRDEARELLDDLDPLIAQLAEGDTSPGLIDHLFRLSHTLKGSAAAVGFALLSRAAHLLEDQFEVLRDASGPLPQMDLFDAVSTLRALAKESGDTPLARDLLAQIREQLTTRDAGPAGPQQRAQAPKVTALAATPKEGEPAEVSIERRDSSQRRRGDRRGDDERLVRVDAVRLDGLLSAVGEIVFRRTLIERRSEELTGLVRDLALSHQSLRAAITDLRGQRGADRYVQRFSELEVEFSDVVSNLDRAGSGLREETAGLRRDAQFLQEGLTQIRLLSVRYLFARLRRSVRDIARSEGKQVILETQGEETEIDKVVAEKIADPMIQIIRNAVAHGIESPATRRQAGKPEAGTITITANQEGSFVILEVLDNGCGIDLEAIREALVDKGLMNPEEAQRAQEAEVTAAIFLPGLSTRRTADGVAGRGVGLDLVRDTIVKLGGEVTVSSARGKGTRFVVRMPLSTAITNALLFKSAGEVYCIPVRWVVETRYVQPGEIIQHRGRDAYRHRGSPIPLLWLSRLMGTERRVIGKFIPTIILRYLEFSFALAVDRLVGPREIVLRKLGPLLEPLDIFASATISGAGKVQMVLDTGTLHQWASAWRTLPQTAVYGVLPSTKQKILVCDDSRSIREVVSRILLAEGYDVEVAGDGWDAWERLTEVRIDLVLTDLEMPRMDGYALIEKIRRADDFEKLPILVLSSRTGEVNQRRARQAGADGFLFKPVNRRVIIARIQELLRGIKARST